MRIRGIGTAKLLARLAREQFGSPGALVLGYHRIAKSPWDPQSICVSPEHFEEQLAVLKKFARPVSLSRFVQALSNGEKLDKMVVVTFDDAYEDTANVAVPLMRRYSIPATVFVPTEMIGKSFWWCDLQGLVEGLSEIPESIEFDVCGRSFSWTQSVDSLQASAHLLNALAAYFRPLSVSAAETAFGHLEARLKLSDIKQSRVKAMSANQVAELASSELFDVGSHTMNHLSLSDISEEEQVVELISSKASLEKICGRQIGAFAFPNGAIPSRAAQKLSASGYFCGVTSRVAPVKRGSNPYLLPRPFVGDWDGDTFARWLARWLR